MHKQEVIRTGDITLYIDYGINEVGGRQRFFILGVLYDGFKLVESGKIFDTIRKLAPGKYDDLMALHQCDINGAHVNSRKLAWILVKRILRKDMWAERENNIEDLRRILRATDEEVNELIERCQKEGGAPIDEYLSRKIPLWKAEAALARINHGL
jgi:hypothetical protein